MTLSETIKVIEEVAKRQPSVNMIVRHDVLRLNSMPNRKYGVFAWLQDEHSGTSANDIMEYRFVFFYVDRLTEDRSNETEIQSVGIQTLDNIIRALYDAGICADNWTFRAFTQRFVDECAGVWCEVTFGVPVSLVCPETFGDYSAEDSNIDFLIY